MLYQAFGWAPPAFAHVGLLVNEHKQKLSKRNSDIGIDSFQANGTYPPALLNFAVLLGWNLRQATSKTQVMTLLEMAKLVSYNVPNPVVPTYW